MLLVEVDVAAQTEEHDEEAEGDQAGSEAEADDPMAELFAIHGKSRQKQPTEDRQAAEDRGPQEGTEPEDLALRSEAALVDDDRLAEAEDDTGEDTGEGARGGLAAQLPRGERAYRLCTPVTIVHPARVTYTQATSTGRTPSSERRRLGSHGMSWVA